MSEPIQRIHEIVTKATAGMTPEQLAQPPAPGKWSVAEILEHLMLTYTGTAKGMQRCLDEGHPLVTRQSLKQRVLSHLISRLGYFPQGRTAPKQVTPRGEPVTEILPKIHASLLAMDAAMDAVEQRFGRGKVLDHPILGALTPDQWRGFHAAHAHHHVKQIVAIRARMHS